MEAKTKKSALNETTKAEVKKVVSEKPKASSKIKSLKPRLAETTTKPASKVQPKNAEVINKTEKKQRKQKIIRDKFSMPESEYRMLATLKKQCLAVGVTVKKNELLRAGIKALTGMNQADLDKHLAGMIEEKAGKATKDVKDK